MSEIFCEFQEKLNKFWNGLIDYVYPLKCVFCGKIFGEKVEIEICENCMKNISLFDNTINWPSKDFYEPKYCDGSFVICEYEGIVRSSIILFKFFEKEQYFRAFGRLMAKRLATYHEQEPFDAVLAVPLHRKRLIERGYNQSELLVNEICEELSTENISDIIIRCRNTPKQSLLNAEQRAVNISCAFELTNSDKIRLKKILIVDDILTTGSTVEECAKVLKDGGAKSVFVAVIASGRNNLYGG